MPGSISGGDWGLPDNISQAKVFFESLLHSWTRTSNIFGARQLSMPLLIVIAPSIVISYLGISLATIFKVFLVLVFAFAASNFNLFLRYVGLRSVPAFIGDLVFILSPVFFNYSLMGWLFVLVSLSIIPLFIYLYLRAIDEDNYKFALLASLLFSVAAIQSQSVMWFLLILAFVAIGYGTLSKKLPLALKYGLLIFVSYVLVNSYWLYSFIFFPDLNATGSDLVQSTISVGTSDNMNIFNILKLWGGLFNSQFELSYLKAFSWAPYMIPLIALSSLLFWKKYGRHISYLLLIFFTIIFLFFLGRSLLSNLPFSNLIRDVSRFTILSTFALVALFSITLNQIYIWKSNYRFLIFVPIFLLLLINIYPFLSGKQFFGQQLDHDFRLRTKVWPSQYNEVNEMLSNVSDGDRALYLPMGGMLSITNEESFRGAFMEAQDVYSGYSPIPSMISMSDRSLGASSDLVDHINTSIMDMDEDELYINLSQGKVGYLVVRNDVDMYDWNKPDKDKFKVALWDLIENGKAEVFYDEGPVYALKLLKVGDVVDSTFEKINPSSYRLDASEFDGDLVINLYENFDPYWELVDSEGLFADKIVSNENHYVYMGYANGFKINSKNIESKESVYIVYKPERFLSLFAAISLVSLFAIILVFLLKRKKHN